MNHGLLEDLSHYQLKLNPTTINKFNLTRQLLELNKR